MQDGPATQWWLSSLSWPGQEDFHRAHRFLWRPHLDANASSHSDLGAELDLPSQEGEDQVMAAHHQELTAVRARPCLKEVKCKCTRSLKARGASGREHHAQIAVEMPAIAAGTSNNDRGEQAAVHALTFPGT